MSENSTFVDTELPSPITEFVVQIISDFQGEGQYACGTGVIVAPHLAFGAKHVLEDHWIRHQGRPLPTDGEVAGDFSFILGQVVNDSANLWTVTRLWTSGHTDIVALRLTPFSEGATTYNFRHLAMNLMPPKKGERIHAFGYCDSVVEATGPKRLTVKHRAATTHGEVIEVHHKGRDTVKMPFPCFRTNARFDGGMSGGPVFNESGELCGLVCSSYPPFTEEEAHASYAVALWPAMGIPIDIDREGHPPGVRYPMFELVSQNILVARNADRVTVGPLSEAEAPTVGFRLPADTEQ